MHVLPKARPLEDDDEKTTIESGWEEEDASTTVEQGEVADKLRQMERGLEPAPLAPILPNGFDGPLRRTSTGVTSTGANSLEESTVEEQRSNLMPGAARMVIVAGNDVNKAFAIDGAKSYTIGRGLDNDIVLADLAVSRKHFDLRYENGAWVIVDRGSGNGTVVNGNLEDNPFMLANGDAIEIGNTTFRFEQQAPAVPQPLPQPSSQPLWAPAKLDRSSQPTFDIDVESEADVDRSASDEPDEDDEPSTVAGKPIGQLLATPSEPVLLPVSAPVSQSVPSPIARPKTLPPPTPLRMSSQYGVERGSQHSQHSVHSQHTAQRAAQSGLSASGMQPELPPMQSPQPQPMRAPTGDPWRAPDELPFSLSPPPQLARPASTLPLPQMANRPPLAPPGQPTLLGDIPGLVPSLAPIPTTLTGQGPAMRPSMQPGFYPSAHELPSGHQHLLVVAPQQPRRLDASTANVSPTPYDGLMPLPNPMRFAPPQLSRRMKLGLGFGALTLLVSLVTIAVLHGHREDVAAAPPPATNGPAQPPPQVAQKAPAPAPKQVLTPLTGPSNPPPQPPPPVVVPVPVHRPIVTPVPQPIVTPAPPVVAATTQPAHATPSPPPSPSSHTTTSSRPTSTPSHTDTHRVAVAAPVTPTQTTAPALTDSSAIDNARSRADDYYKTKRFADAANVLATAAKVTDAETAHDLKLKAQSYAALGKAYNQGMAPGTDADVAFDYLRQARTYDRQAGGHFAKEISDRLAAIAPQAALTFAGNADLERARNAVVEADQNGLGANSNIKIVKTKLENAASSLYSSAQQQGFDTTDGKDKLRKIRLIVDPSSAWYVKANRALNGG